MAKAFQCDLWGELEQGEPLGKSTFEVTDPDSPRRQKLEEEWCVDCLASFQDWRETRIPVDDQDAPDDEDPEG